jgi:hypothetical protein
VQALSTHVVVAAGLINHKVQEDKAALVGQMA